jgi:hypothetical protein
MNLSRIAAFSRTALGRPLRSGTQLAWQPDAKVTHVARKFSAYASHVPAEHRRHEPTDERSTNANVQLELGLRFTECTTHNSAVLELDLDELSEAVESFLHRRTLAGFSDAEEALHAMSDQLAARASVLYFHEIDTERIQANPDLFSIFKRLEERKVTVLCPPPFVPLRRTVGNMAEA